jgi:hypothetical protein
MTHPGSKAGRIRNGRSTGSVEVYQKAALKAGLVTPATRTGTAGKSSASPGRNIPGKSGRGIRACTIFGKGCVRICCSCFGSASSSVLTRGKKGRYAKRDQSCRQPRFFSHKETILARIVHVNRDLAEKNSSTHTIGKACGFSCARKKSQVQTHCAHPLK